jgi:hypothetical protein
MAEEFDYMGRIQELGEMVYAIIIKPENQSLFEFIRDTDPEHGFMWMPDTEWPGDALKQFQTIETDMLEDEGFSGAAYGFFMRNLQYRICNNGEAPKYTD